MLPVQVPFLSVSWFLVCKMRRFWLDYLWGRVETNIPRTARQEEVWGWNWIWLYTLFAWDFKSDYDCADGIFSHEPMAVTLSRVERDPGYSRVRVLLCVRPLNLAREAGTFLPGHPSLPVQLPRLRAWSKRQPLRDFLLGEAHWLKPPTLARHHSNHLHELFYDRISR